MSKKLLARSLVAWVSTVAMTRQEYNDVRSWQLPENEDGSDAGFLVEDPNGQKNTPQYDGFVQWLPRAEFERKYIVESDEKHPKECESPKASATVDFGSAIWALKKGKKVARSGWNGKGMWLSLIPKSHWETTRGLEMLDGLPWIGMKTVDDKFVPWLASQTDVLAEDWVVL